MNKEKAKTKKTTWELEDKRAMRQKQAYKNKNNAKHFVQEYKAQLVIRQNHGDHNKSRFLQLVKQLKIIDGKQRDQVTTKGVVDGHTQKSTPKRNLSSSYNK